MLRAARRLRRGGNESAADALAALRQAVDELHHRVARLELHDEAHTMADWIEHVTLATCPLVSVIVPTRDRSEYLERSIGSLLAQAYTNWEAVVVDDGSTDATAARLASFTDSRVRSIRTDGMGCGAARNVGLDHAKGDLIAYLDDDNRMHPLWLKAVVWAFEQRPDVDSIYGGVVIDDTARHNAASGWNVPSLWLQRFDLRRVVVDNVADMGAIAHRAGTRARFDTTLDHGADWDFLLQLVAEKHPLALPMPALHYMTDAVDRLSYRATKDADLGLIRRRHAWLASDADSGGRAGP